MQRDLDQHSCLFSAERHKIPSQNHHCRDSIEVPVSLLLYHLLMSMVC